MAQEPSAPASAPPVADARVAGHWLGIYVIQPAVSELEMLIDLAPDAAAWKGSLSLPVRGVAGFPLKDVKVEGKALSFSYTYSAGTSTFHGTLAADGDSISGTLFERGKFVPFQLTRRPDRPIAAAPQLRVVTTSEELKRLFNEQSQKTRLVLLISPNCGRCKAAARIVERYLLDTVDSKDLVVLVLWEQAVKEDSEEKAAAAAALVPDPRAIHLWMPDPTLADPFGKAAGVKSSPAVDLYLLYPPHATWGETAPAPARVMYGGGDGVPADRFFNGTKLVAEVREAMAQKR